MTVFVVSKPRPGPSGIIYDVSPAQEYGEVKFIFDAYENPSNNPAASLLKARSVLDNFNDHTDYIVSAGGDPYGLFLVGFIIAELGMTLRWLKFERLRLRPDANQQTNHSPGYYIPVEIPLNCYTYVREDDE